MKRSLHQFPLLLLITFCFASAGCSKSSNSYNPGGGTQTVNMSISGFAFSPATLTVKTGTVIKVTNNDAAAHTLTADDTSFDTGNIPAGGTGTVTVSKAGTFPFHCTYHSRMTGTLTVTN